jgi:hypothetical protein
VSPGTTTPPSPPDYKHCGCKYEDPRQEELSHVSFGWTKEHTSDDTKKILGALPFRLDVKPNGGHASGPTLILRSWNANAQHCLLDRRSS